MPEKFANDVETTITVASAGATTGTLASASNLPAVPFRAIIQDSATSAVNREYVIVTAIVTLTATISRAVEDAARFPAVAHGAGSYFAPIVTAKGLYNLYYFDVRAYGAKGDGVTDDTAAIQAAIDACTAEGGGTVLFTAGTYLALTINHKSFVRLFGTSGATIRKNGGIGNTSIINATGTLGTAVALNANAAASAALVTAATNPATLVAGDYVMIRDATYKYGSSGRNQEINRIKTVTGSGPYTFNLINRTMASYATASTAEIIKMTPVVDATVDSLTLQIPSGTSGGVIVLDLTVGYTVRDSLFTGAKEMAAFYALQSARGRFIDNDVRDGQIIDVDTGHGIVLGGSSHHWQITGNSFENFNQNAFSNNTRDVNFLNNVCLRADNDAVNSHGTGNERINISDNIISGSNQFGISISGSDWAPDIDITVARNFIFNSEASAISAGGSLANPVRGLHVSDNRIFGWNRSAGGNEFGILASYCIDATIEGNKLDGMSLGGTLPQTGIRIQDCQVVQCESNTVRNLSWGTGVSFYACTQLEIKGNQLSAVNFDNISSLGGTMVNVYVRDNQSDDTSRTQGGPTERWENNIWGTFRDGLPSGTFAPGSFTVATSNYVNVIDRLEMTTTQQAIIEGTGILRID